MSIRHRPIPSIRSRRCTTRGCRKNVENDGIKRHESEPAGSGIRLQSHTLRRNEMQATRVRFPSPAPDPNAKAPDTNQCQGLSVFRLYRVKPRKDRKRPLDFGGGAAGRFLFLTSSASRPVPTGPDRYPEAAAGALRRCAARWRTFPRPTHVPGR